MTDPQTLSALAAKLCEAKEGSRELDARIACAVKHPQLRPARPDDFDGEYGYQPGNLKVEHGFLQADFYTTSLDAKLPGEDITYVGIHPNGTWSAEDSRRTGQPARAYTEPLARRAAALLAMAEKEREG